MSEVRPYRGGRVEPDDEPLNPRRYPCAANGCPMPGTIWPGATQGGTGDRPGTCAWHYSAHALDWPRVTQVLLEWACVSYEVNECRRVHCQVGDAKAEAKLFPAAVERLREAVKDGGWGDRFEAQPDETYRQWGMRLEEFLGGQVVQAMTTRQRRAA